MPSITQQFQSSELSRSSQKVFEAASQEPVRITRRDGENLILMTEKEVERQETLFTLAAQLVALSTRTLSDEDLVADMSLHFPWILALKNQDQKACARDIINDSRASFSLGNPTIILGTLNAWHDAAQAVAADYPRVSDYSQDIRLAAFERP